MSLSSELQPTLITVLSSPLCHAHTPAAKSLAELLQEDPRTDRRAVDQLLKQYGLLYKVGVVGQGTRWAWWGRVQGGRGGAGSHPVPLHGTSPFHCRIFLRSAMNWGVFLLWGNLTHGRGGWAWPGPWSTSRCT